MCPYLSWTLLIWPTIYLLPLFNALTTHLYDKALLPRSVQIGFIWSTSVSTPRIWYADSYTKPRRRYHPSGANSKVGHNWPSSLSVRGENAVAGPSFFQLRRLRANLIIALKIFTGLSDTDPNIFFSPSHSTWLKRVLQDNSHRRRSGSAFSMSVVKYWNKLPTSVVTAPSVNIFRGRVRSCMDRGLSASPWMTSFSNWALTFPFLNPPVYLHFTIWH